MDNERSKRALIVDDEADICYLLGNLLNRNNIPAAFAGSLTDAAAKLEEKKFDIIFLDNHLPDGKGMNFIGYIKNRFPETKVVMVTANDTAEDKGKALEKGADFFVGKPFSKDHIMAALGKVM